MYFTRLPVGEELERMFLVVIVVVIVFVIEKFKRIGLPEDWTNLISR